MGIQEIQQLKQSEDSEHGQNLGKGVQQKKQLHDSRPAGETEPGKSVGSRDARSHGKHHCTRA